MLRRVLAVTVATLSVAACSDNTSLIPTLPVTTDTLVAYALNGTPAGLPSGLATTFRSTVRVDGTATFDVAFDIDPSGKIVVSPVRAIVSPLIGAPLVGIQLSDKPFESITRAPGGYYRPDTATVVSPGQVLLLVIARNTGSPTCYYTYAPQVYAKIVIDSVQAATTRAIYLRQTVDPNCGFRSFEPGLPTS